METLDNEYPRDVSIWKKINKSRERDNHFLLGNGHMSNQPHVTWKRLNDHCRGLWELLTSRTDYVFYIL